ncbi:MAG: hypothetical protein ACOC2M_03040 [bacterium]
MSRLQQIIPFILTFWAGFVSAISFLEAWLKFQAEGVTRETGLSIGKLVFTALNRVELLFLVSVWVILFVQKQYKIRQLSANNFMLWFITVILIIQTFWLLPKLVERAEIIIAGNVPPDSLIHLFYILFELIKVIVLIVLSFKFRSGKVFKT